MSAEPGLDPVLNPYVPGAGARPRTLAGREGQLSAFDITAQRVRSGQSAQITGVVGLRGVGKTVLLRSFADIAERHDLHATAIEGSAFDLLRGVTRGVRRLLLELRGGRMPTRALRVLRSFSVTFPVGIGVELSPLRGQADSGDLDSDLTDLLLATGAAAASQQRGLLLAIDEVQTVPAAELGALMAALHRMAQEQLPVTAALAGLPDAVRAIAAARTYAERMVAWQTLDRLDQDDAGAALTGPSAELGIRWTTPAVAAVVERSEGYPYFLQEYGRHVWNVAAGDPIRLTDVERAEPRVRGHLDEGFFRGRLDRVPDSERRYLVALAGLGQGERRSGDVARAMHKTTQQVGALRDRLIAEGICYSPRYGYVAFSVPQFDSFIRRTLGPAT